MKRNRINILEIHGRSTQFGGASAHTAMLVDYFSKKEGNTVLIYQKGNGVFKRANLSNRVDIYEYDLSSLMLLPVNIWRIYKIVKKNEIEIIHSHHRNADFLTGIIKILNRKVKTLTTIHGRLRIGDGEHRIKYIVLRNIVRFIYERYFNEVVFISKYTMQINYDYFKKVKKKTVVYNGSLKLKTTKSRDQTREELQIRKDDFVVTLLGAMEGVKRPHILLEVGSLLKRNKDIWFLFVGNGEQIPSLRERAKKEGINTIFPGWRKDVGDIIFSSNIIVSTAIHEGFGRTLTEAMMLAKPVIAFNTAGPSEIINDGEWGYLIEDGDIKGFSNAIYSIYSDKTLEKTLGQNGRKAAEERFSNNVFCENYEKTFKELLSDV